MLEKEMISEQNKFSEVKDFLSSEILRLSQLIEQNKKDIKTQGSDFNRDNPNGGMYSGMELTQIHYDMEKKMVDSRLAEEDIFFYKKLINSPYFARVDFRPQGASKERTVYIGLRTLQDPVTFKTYVCDWRAPVSSLFYDDFDDKAYFEAPSGRIYGDLLLKRQYKFQNGQLKSFINSELKIDDDILREILSSSSGESLKVIVNSIQREQNNAVRYSDKHNLLVLGPAGSGKTSVGFHRLAYLLYRNRTELSSGEIVMFTNNKIFSDYVADIIPELGEKPINYASFDGIFKAEIPDYYVEDYYSLAEKALNSDKSELLIAKEKSSDEFIEYLEDSIKDFVPKFEDISLCGFPIISAFELLERYNICEGAPGARGEAIANYTQTLITNIFNENKDIISDRIIDEKGAIGEDEKRLINRELKEFKENSLNMIKNATTPDAVEAYYKVLRQYAEEKNMKELVKSEENLKEGYLDFQDGLGIVFLKTCYRTSAVLSGIKHILIDEAQDYSKLQHIIIKRMFSRAKFTILADTNQAVIDDVNSFDEEILASVYDAKPMRLNKSYRSTKEINEFSVALLPKEKRYDIFRRDGETIEFLEGDISALIEKSKTLSEDKSTFCIITKTEKTALDLFKKFENKIPDLWLCSRESGSISGAPVVMPLMYTKGLEFDKVLIYNNEGAFDGEKNKRYLYLAATRALHKLYIFND